MSTPADRSAWRVIRAITLVALLAACGGQGEGRSGRGDSAAATGGQGAATTADTGGMPGMPGMPGMQHGGGMAMGGGDTAMAAHMRRMEQLPPDSLAAVLPEHRQMVANMLARMNREMSGMNMKGDAAWDATVDSLRQDLRTMPEWSSGERTERMPGHRARVARLMRMHGAMMRGM